MIGLAGKYRSTSDSDSGLELETNGSFYFYGNAGGITGKYSISGDTIMVKSNTGVAFRFDIRGADLVHRGEVYTRDAGLAAREDEIRKRLAIALDAEARKAPSPPAFATSDIAIRAPRRDWDRIAEKIMQAATALDGSAAKGLPDDAAMDILADVPSHRVGEFRRTVARLGGAPPADDMSSGQSAGSADARTIVKTRITER